MEQPRQPAAPPPAYTRQRRPSRWWIPLLIIGIIVIVILILLIGGITFIISAFETSPVIVRSNTVLFLNVRGLIQERTPESPLSILTTPVAPTHLEILEAIRTAQRDPNIAAIAFETASLRAGWVKSSEILAALDSFRTSGKPVYAFIEFGNERDYYLASVADSIFASPHGLVEFNGFAVVSPFFRKALNTLGIDIHVEAFEEYKSAGESVARSRFSPAARDAYTALLQTYKQHFAQTVSHYRGISTDTVIALLHRGIYRPKTLLRYGLIDSLMTYAQFLNFLEQRIGIDTTNSKSFPQLRVDIAVSHLPSSDRLRKISVSKYLSSTSYLEIKERTKYAKKTIAVIIAAGSIVPKGQEQYDDPAVVTEHDYVRYLRNVARDTTIDGVILRIDSPGGSASASDGIWSAIQEVRKNKPIYAVFSDLAASGGYYIAAACDTIIAHPLSVTGSIGVILLYPSFARMMDKLDITIDSITTDPTAVEFTPWFPISEPMKQKLHQMGKEAYDLFIDRVAYGRNLPEQTVRRYAKGRIWTGDTAVALGLADLVGNFDLAFRLMKRRLGIADTVPVKLQIYPRPKDPIERLIELFFQDMLVSATSDGTSPTTLLHPFLAVIPSHFHPLIYHWWTLTQCTKAQEYIFATPLQLPVVE